jgi:hypothetical protein
MPTDNPIPNEKDLINNMMAKLFDIITNGDGTTVPKSEDNFFTWCTPGIPFEEEDFDFLIQGLTGVLKQPEVTNENGERVTKELTPEERDQLLASDTTRMYQQAEQFARIVNIVPDASGIDDAMARMNVKNDEGTLSDIYEEILRFSQVVNTELSDDDKAKIERFRQLLQVEREKEDLITGEKVKVLVPSPLQQAYEEKSAAWMDAALEYNSARISALTASTPRDVHNWAINANVLRSKVTFALNDWINNGYKNEFEGIAARIDQMTSRDLTLLKAQYKDALEKAKLTGLASGSDFYFTSLAPANFARSKGWTRFTFTNNDNSYYSKAENKKWGASARVNLGLFSFGGGGGQQKTSMDTNIDLSHFEMSFEISQIPIIRPWFKSNFITSKTWRFAQGDEGFKSKFVSDGERPPHPDSMMPAYPTNMIFVRNLRMVFTNSSSVVNMIDSKVGGGGSVGWGPFSIGGGYKKGTTERNMKYHRDSQGIYVDGLQCIGFKCHLFPKAPNPDPAITKWV